MTIVQLVEMEEQPYPTEDVLQGLLAKYPNLLAGNQINIDKPRKWLLVSREASLHLKKMALIGSPLIIYSSIRTPFLLCRG